MRHSCNFQIVKWYFLIDLVNFKVYFTRIKFIRETFEQQCFQYLTHSLINILFFIKTTWAPPTGVKAQSQPTVLELC